MGRRRGLSNRPTLSHRCRPYAPVPTHTCCGFLCETAEHPRSSLATAGSGDCCGLHTCRSPPQTCRIEVTHAHLLTSPQL